MIDWPALLMAVAAVIGALGIKEIIQGWSAKRSGEAQEEKKRMQELIQENDVKDARIDELLKGLRIMKEYATELRVKLMERGVPYQDLPDWPRGE